VARGYGSHCAVEALAKGLCWDCRLRGVEEAVVEASLSALRVPIGTVLAKGCGWCLVAAGMGKETVLDRMRGIGTTVLAKDLVSVALGRTAPEKQLESGRPGVGTTVRETPRANTADSSSVARVRLPCSRRGTVVGALERRPYSRRGTVVEALAREPCAHCGTAARALERRPYVDRDTGAEGQAIRPCTRHGTA
jgi:hypothetical protein